MAGSGARDDEESLGSDGSNMEKSDFGAQFDESIADLPMNLEEALRDPIYLVSLDPEVKACIVCPGKLLKNNKMSDIHMSSNVSIFPFIIFPKFKLVVPVQAHKRRFAKFVAVSKDQDDIAGALYALNAESAPKSLTDSHPTSKRAQKRVSSFHF
jgi:hypothetical protein